LAGRSDIRAAASSAAAICFRRLMIGPKPSNCLSAVSATLK
jgi:hypothetical protein